jgi:hypothetical protein
MGGAGEHNMPGGEGSMDGVGAGLVEDSDIDERVVEVAV